MHPSPTPYDITQIPIFPYIPPAWIWILLIVLIIIIYLFLLNIRQQNQSSLRDKAINLLLIDLNFFVAGQIIQKTEISKASILVRRFLESKATEIDSRFSNLTTFSEKEIFKLKDEINLTYLKELLLNLGNLEALRFMAESNDQAKSILKQIILSLETLKVSLVRKKV